MLAPARQAWRSRRRRCHRPAVVALLLTGLGVGLHATPPAVRTGASPAPATAPALDDQAEARLDRYFAAPTAVAREAALADLEQTPLRGRQEDWQRLREVADRRQTVVTHAPVPWRRGTARGWYNLSLPPDYQPQRAWPLVLALHGMPSDGDNLVPFYQDYFTKRGYLVVFPTTLSPASYWPDPDEQRELRRLLRYLGSNYRLDYRRLYCTGASGGGIGVWHWLVTEPRLFAAGISFSAAATIQDERLRALKGTPFYVHHGTADPIPLAPVAAAVKLARGYGAAIEFYVSPGTGHTPPPEDAARAFAWLERQPRNPVYARWLVEGQAGALPPGYARLQPFQAAAARDVAAPVAADQRRRAAGWTFPAAPPTGELVARCAAVARVVEPTLDGGRLETEVAELAARVARACPPALDDGARLLVLNRVLFEELGFGVAADDPGLVAPDATVLPAVLRARRGNTLGLAALYCAVAQRLRLAVYPVVTPYHCFLRFWDAAGRSRNLELTENGAGFDDRVYLAGYGLRALPSRPALQRESAANLIAAQLAALASGAHQAGYRDVAMAGADAALAADPDCYRAQCLKGELLGLASQPAAAAKLLRLALGRWPQYAQAPFALGGSQPPGQPATEADRWYREAAAAPLKPPGGDRAFTADVYYRIACLHEDTARDVVRGHSVDLGELRLCFDALTKCLKHEPTHAAAQRLWVELGGRITAGKTK